MEQYTVLGRVGEGAHGIVMRARHNQSGDLMSPARHVTCDMLAACCRPDRRPQEDPAEEAGGRHQRGHDQGDPRPAAARQRLHRQVERHHPHHSPHTDGRPVQAVRCVPPGPRLRPRVRVSEVRPGGGHQGHGAAPHPARDQVRRPADSCQRIFSVSIDF